MIRNALYILSLLLLSASSHGKDTVLVGYQALNRIYEIDKPLFFGHRPLFQKKILKLNKELSAYSHELIKTNNRLFIRVDGTGRVYEVKQKRGDSLRIERLDSTVFFGYNGNSISFIYKDTIMSFGGEGYWRINGQLRYFSEKSHEWDIIPINHEIPVTNQCVYIDETNENVFYIQLPYIEYATNTVFNETNVYKLNLATKSNVLLGKLHPELLSHFPQRIELFTVPIPSLKMQLLAHNGSSIFLLDFLNNEVYKIQSRAIEKALYGNSKQTVQDIIFENNGFLFYTTSNDPNYQLDSVRISLKDFQKTGFTVYTPASSSENIYYLIIPAIAVIIIIALVYNRRKNRVAEKIRIEQQFAMSDNNENTFKPVELELIQKIYAVSQLGKSYSVEDVNTALGLGRKSLEIQKKTRTDTLNRINHRFKMQFETQDDLIERVRSDEDRRYYRYFIREENMKKLMS